MHRVSQQESQHLRILLLSILLSVSCVQEIAADEIRASQPVETADGTRISDEFDLPKFDLEIEPDVGGLKPVEYVQPLWVPTSQAVDEPADPEDIDALPPLDLETKTNTDQVRGGKVKIVEEDVDLRVPTTSSPEEVDVVSPSWMNPFIDDHIYLWHENREELEILFQDKDGFGMTTLAFDGKIHDDDGPMWANFKFAWHFLKGPLQPDVRAQTYDLTFEVNHAEQLNDTWGVHFQISPTWATDWDNKTGDAFRLIGGGLISMKYDDGVSLLFGATYLDRPDLPVVPTAGVRIWDEDFELDLVVPRPRIAWRTDTGENEKETWVYFAGELGGGSWAIEREFNRKDIMGYRDYRLLVGCETKEPDGSRQVLEFGWVFDRRIDFDRYGGSQHLGDTAVIRIGQTY
ncbi:hypothetical protein [Thalassoglobus polymorphus]|uniref:Uncharacterized protein n=1 Tax=Thalassoglobus polymorphus TaxID=2527994 RepID=A0A517QJA1_9PLAN|nr:hypothetical protein [Thalassoglobus polymorphus]QDT31729.1 hypothetical protein Mal48_09640 [Thalassoglobus polymorphus]